MSDLAGHWVVEAFAPGRVNLMGGPDYTGGIVLPMAIQLGTTVVLHSRVDDRMVELTSDAAIGKVRIDLDQPYRGVAGTWDAYVSAGVEAARRHLTGAGVGRISTTLPLGAGLSSSAALVASVAVALGLPTADDDPASVIESARQCQIGEHLIAGVRTGIMDQIACFAGVKGSMLVLDCTTLEYRPVPIPASAELIVAHCGESRRLAVSRYAERRAECEAATAIIGCLATAHRSAIKEIRDPAVAKRARHVISEGGRALAAVDAMTAGDLEGFGRLLSESHASLASDFEVSTPALDSLVEVLCNLPGVHGARLTGGGSGGCAVAVAERGALRPDQLPYRSWVVEPSAGARRALRSI